MSEEKPLTNYVAYETQGNWRGNRIGHLDLDQNTITPLAHTSGTLLSNLYEVIEVGQENIIPAGPPIPRFSVTILAPLAGRDVLAIGKNYSEHAKEFNASGYDASDKVDMPSHPVVFTKRATSIIADGEHILPFSDFTSTLDYEGEIGVIIGKAGHKIPESEASSYVWGYTIINDVTARERQRDHKQFYIGKSGDTFCPMGPIAVPKEALPSVLTVQTRVNGEQRQQGTTNDLIFSVNYLIKTLSESQTLQPGDVIATGTPAGVGFGFKPPQFLKPNDVVEISVTGLGTLANKIADFSTKNHVQESVSTRSVIPTHNLRNGSKGLTTLDSGKQVYASSIGVKSNPTIIFIHELGHSHASLLPLLRKSDLPRTHYCILYDIEGHGLTPTRANSVVSIQSYATDLLALLQTAEFKPIGRVTIIAHGIGCLIAAAASFESKDLIEKAIFISPPKVSISQHDAENLRNSVRSLREGHGLLEADSSLEAQLSKTTLDNNPLVLAFLQQARLACHEEGYAKGLTALAEADTSQREAWYKGLTYPLLAIVGDQDGDFTDKDAWDNKDGKTEMIVINGAGHWPILENVGKVGDAVRGFIGRA